MLRLVNLVLVYLVLLCNNGYVYEQIYSQQNVYGYSYGLITKNEMNVFAHNKNKRF